jgi:hypothetical protein
MLELAKLGIGLVTAPNFSLVLDNPRTDDLHSIKRIALIFSEFENAGITCAVHPNSRTVQDFVRWRNFIAVRTEIQIISYEFITGAGRTDRQQFHLEGLANIAKGAGRDLDIVVRGQPTVVPFLRHWFRNVLYIDTSAFMKTLKRQRAVRVGNKALTWSTMPTLPGQSVHELLLHNDLERSAHLHISFFQPEPAARNLG